jgi:hypothetical protein
MTEIKNIQEAHSHGRNSLQNGFHSATLSKLKKSRLLCGVELVSVGKHLHFIQ